MESRNPFKGAQSYGAADGDLFFGRDTEGAALARFLQDQPFAVLTAPSGIGKTSLLNARVIPLLEQERWYAAIGRPEEDPVKSLQKALTDNLFPDPRDEALVAEQLLEAMHSQADLQSALDWYKNLCVEDRVKFRFFAPPSVKDFRPLPLMSRALRGSMASEDLIEQFEALVSEGAPLGISRNSKLSEIIQLMRQPEVSCLWRQWQNRITEAHGISATLKLLEDEWLPLRPGTAGILLILDQAEEVFTRLPRSKFDEFMTEARNLFEWLPGKDLQPSSKPVHLAVSLRKEFFADLLPHLRRFGPAERLTFFLGPLTLDQARQALGRPAKLFVDLAPAQGDATATIDRILTFALDEGTATDRDDAAIDDLPVPSMPSGPRYSPTLISLIGAHLWNAVEAMRATGGEITHSLNWRQFRGLVPRLENVFESFLAQAMEQMELNAQSGGATRFDALELLDRLVTANGFRNIVQEDELVNELPLRADVARVLLETVDRDLKLIRRESRRGGRLVEIMHERLIPPVRHMLNELRRQDINRATLLPAHDMLYILPDDANATVDPLPPHFRDALVQYIDRFDLDFLAAKILFRSVLIAGPGKGDGAHARWNHAIQVLAEALSSLNPPSEGRAALFHGAKLHDALTELSNAGRASDRKIARHLVLSALSDRTDGAGPRIRQTIENLINSEAPT